MTVETIETIKVKPAHADSRRIPARTLIAVAVLALAQAACGGGGGGDSGAPSAGAGTGTDTTPGGGGDTTPGTGNNAGGDGTGNNTNPTVTPQKVSATVSGLTGSGLTLLNNGGDALAVAADGAVTFATSINTGSPYAVTVGTQPSGQVCAVSNGSGTIASADVTNVTVACEIALAGTSVAPADTTTGVSRGVAPVMSFSTNINASTVTSSSVTLTSAAGAKSASLSTNNNTVTISPAGALFPLTTYTVSATTGVQTASGQPLGSAFNSTFTTADGTWQAALGLDGVGATGTASPPSFATDSAGNAVAVWIYDGSTAPYVNYATYSAASDTWTGGGTFGTVTQGLLSEQSNPMVAMDGAGNATVVFTRFDGAGYNIHTATLAAGATAWSTPIDVVTGLATDTAAQLTVDAAGNATVAYMVDTSGVKSLYSKVKASSASAWSAPVRVDTQASPGTVTEPKLAIDGTGKALVTWVSGGNQVVVNTSTDNGATWGTAAQINQGAAVGSTSTQAAFDKNGNALVVWSEGNADPTKHVYSNRFAGLTPGSAVQVDTSASGNDADRPNFAFDPMGNALIVWAQLASGTVVMSSSAPVNGAWSTPAAISANVLTTGSTPKVLLDGGGNGLAVWGQTETWNSGANSTYHAYSSRYVAGTWGTPAAIDSIGTQNGSYTSAGVSSLAKLATDANGNAFATWLQYADGANAAAYVVRWR